MRQVLPAWSMCFVSLCAWLGGGVQPAQAHGHEPPWLAEGQLDQGVYIDVQAPRVLRARRPFDIKVSIGNMNGKHDIVVSQVRYVPAGPERVVAHALQASLPTQSETFEACRSTVAEMHRAADRRDAAAVDQLARRYSALLNTLAGAVVTDRHRIGPESLPRETGQSFSMLIEIELLDGNSRRLVTRRIEVPLQDPLPRGLESGRRWRFDVPSGEMRPVLTKPQARPGRTPATWFAGDQHLHTTYSLDALILDGTTETVTDYAAMAELIGLDWIIVTDHSNVHYNHQGTDFYTPAQFDAGAAEAAAYTASHDLLVLYGQEMGAGRSGFFALPSHYLAYPLLGASTGYLANPSSGLIYGLANCETEQVIIDRVNNAGGFGFIAHPFDSGTLSYAAWNFSNGATGWAGLEIWNDAEGQLDGNDQQSLDNWHGLLNALPGPALGSLPERPGFPNAFPAGLGNSDAHQPGLIGATFTYAWLGSFSRIDVLGALLAGHCVASNGPLLYADLNGARLGEVALLLDGDNDLEVTLATTNEFGPVGTYALTVYVNGVVRTVVPAGGDPGYSMTVELAGLNLSPPDKFVTVRADSTDNLHHAITNPIWLQFTAAGDANADGRIDLDDLPSFVDCLTGPQAEPLPSCDVMDFDRDGDVDLRDFARFAQDLPGPV